MRHACILLLALYMNEWLYRLLFPVFTRVLPVDRLELRARLRLLLLSNLTAFLTLRTFSSGFGNFIFLLSLSIFATRSKDAFFSFSKGASVGSNFLLTPRGPFSPSSFLSNFPMLAVLNRVVASVLSISPLRFRRGLLLEEVPVA